MHTHMHMHMHMHHAPCTMHMHMQVAYEVDLWPKWVPLCSQAEPGCEKGV